MQRRTFCLGLVGVFAPLGAVQVTTEGEGHDAGMGGHRDPLFPAALEIMLLASPLELAEYPVSLIQRHLRIGYVRAKSIVADARR